MTEDTQTVAAGQLRAVSHTLIQRLRQTAAQRERAVAEQENHNLMVVARISHADAVLMNEAADALTVTTDALQGLVSFFDKTGFTTEFLSNARAALTKAQGLSPEREEA